VSDRGVNRPGQARARRGSARPGALGGTLRRAWIGYQRRLDEEMAASGFPERRFPDGRVLRMCARSDQVTASAIGRELGITRQGAGKIVSGLRDRGYVVLEPSTTDGRERVITLTPKATDYLAAQRDAARRIEGELEELLGATAFDALFSLLGELAGEDDDPRMRDYLRHATRMAAGGDST
jgi:DNA-binding MarR family transcriptional regulator